MALGKEAHIEACSIRGGQSLVANRKWEGVVWQSVESNSE